MNLENLAKYTSILLVLLLIPNIAFALGTSNAAVSPSSPVDYSSGAPYQFNITCIDINGNPSAWLNLNGTEYPMSNESDEFYVTVTDLNAGTYPYIFTCNDDTGNVSTSSSDYIVNKATPNTTISVSPGTTVTYGTETIVTCSSDNPENPTITLYRNGSNVSSENGLSVLLPAGSWVYTCDATATDNFTESSDSENVIINKAPTSITLLINGSVQSRSFILNDKNVNFTAQIDVPILNVTLSSDYPGWGDVTGNTTVNTFINVTSGGYFYIRAHSNGNENYESSETVLYFDTSAPTFPNIQTSNNVYDFGKTYQLNVSVQDASVDQVWIEFDGSLYNDTSTPSVQNEGSVYWLELTDLAGGDYNYTWYAKDTLGNNSSTSKTFTVLPKTILFLNITPSWSIGSNTGTIVWCWSNDSRVDQNKIDFHLIPSALEPNNWLDVKSGQGWGQENTFGGSPDGSQYTYTCNFTEEALLQNYTGDSRRTLTVTSVPDTSGPSGSSSSTPTGSLYFSNFKDLTVKAGEKASRTFTLKSTFNSDLSNVNVYLSGEGFDNDWCSINAKTITVPKSGSKTITLTCDVPRSAKTGKYSLGVRAVSTFGAPTASAKLIVEAPAPTRPESEPTEESGPEEEVVAQEATVGEEAEIGEEETPTGFALSPDMLPDVVLIVGFLVSGLIFLFRQNVTNTFMKLGKMEPPTPTEKKIVKPKTSWIDRFGKFYNMFHFTVIMEGRVEVKKRDAFEFENKQKTKKQNELTFENNKNKT